jgi:type I restriction enzyme, S subunit
VTRFQLAQLGNCLGRVSVWNPLRADLNDRFRYIDLSSIDQDTKTIVDARNVRSGDAPSRARQLVRAADVLVSTVRPNLNGVAYITADLDGATASTGFCVLRSEPSKLNSRYLFHWVKSPLFVGEMVSKATGASYPAVSDRIVFESAIPLPSLQEQHRIAAILDQAETLRTQRRAALAQLDSLTQSIFLEMFGDPVSNPKGWPDSILLGEIADIASGVTKGRSLQGKTTRELPYLAVANVQDKYLRMEGIKSIEATDDEIQRYCLQRE